MSDQQLIQQMIMQEQLAMQEQMMQQPFDYGMAQNQMGYGMQGQCSGIPKLTKGQVLENMALFIYQNTKVSVTKMEKIEEIPLSLRHACTQRGVCKLEKFTYQYPTQMGMVSVPFFFCSSCGKMYYCTDYIQ